MNWQIRRFLHTLISDVAAGHVKGATIGRADPDWSPTIGTMSVMESVAEYLANNQIDHSVMECDPDLADTAQFCDAYDIPLENSANAILVASKKPEGLFALCLVLATTRLDVNGVVRRRLGARKVSFASADDTLQKTGQAIGGVTVFAIPEDIPIWVDGAVLDREWVIVGAGTRTAKIRVDPAIFAENSRFEVVDDLAGVPS